MGYRVILALLMASNCYAVETIKATGTVRARIVAPEEFELPTENLDVPCAVVYTEQGATLQVVF